MPQLGPMPDGKTYFKFRADPKAVKQLEHMEASVFPDGFKIVANEYGTKGKRILIVTDRVAKQDIDEGTLLSGNEVGVYDNLLAWALNDKNPDVKIKQVVAFNWPFAWLKNDKNKEQTDDVKSLYFARLRRFVERWKPDSIVLAGVDMYKYVFDQLVGHAPHNLYANRVYPVKWGEHTCPTLGTIDLFRPISWDNKYSKTNPHTLGYLGRGIATAMNGENRFSVDIPDQKDITFAYIHTIEQFNKFYKKLCVQKRVSIDTEATSLARAYSTLLSIQFAWELDKAYFLPMGHPETPFSAKELRYIKRKLCAYFESGKSQYHIYQNGKFDMSLLFGMGVRYNNHRVYDIQGGEFALDENRKLLEKILAVKPYSLDFIAEQRGCTIYRNISFSKGDRGSIKEQHLPDEKDRQRKSSKNNLVIYGCYDVLVPLHLADAQIAEAKARGFKRFMLFVCEQLSDASHAFSQMEYSGYHVDKRYLFTLKSRTGPLSIQIEEEAKKFRESKACNKVNSYLMDRKGVPQGGGLWGNSTWVFDINKPDHLQLLFFNALKLQPVDVKKDGGGRTGKEFQEKYKNVNEVAAYNKYQKLKTLRDTFVNGIYLKMRNDWDALKDNNIRSRYSYTPVVTSRTCLDGATPIYVLDKRGIVPIKKIKAGDWVWSFDKNLKPVATQVEWSGKTKYTETVTITYQPDVGSYKTLVCTPCHRLRLRNGKYRRADQLKPGDRILALERKYSKSEYRYLTYTGMEEDKWHPTVFCKQYNMDYATVIQKLAEHNIDWRKKRSRYNGDDQRITKQMLSEAAKTTNLHDAKRVLKVSYYKAKELLSNYDHNHTIVKVERNKGKRWTYDLTIPKHHNFVANGLCVHNSSSDPNLQNIPAHGVLAKIIKRLFIATMGCLFVKNDYSAHEIRDWANESHDTALASSFYAGLKYRQDLRLIAYSYPEQAINWTTHKEKNGWFSIKEYDKKLAILGMVNDKIVKAIGKAELELEIKGDVHKLNCEIFYKTPVLEVTPEQRQDIKALVFGTVYGKTAAGLARGLGKTEEYAQSLQDTLFEKFPVGGKWLKQIERHGQKHLYVESPLGTQRHLWGYLHNRKGVVNAMNRRGPNSIVQGVASWIGISSIRIMQKLIWHMFTKHNIPFQWRSTVNYVHDSVESEAAYHLIPIYLYMIEHASTTLIHRRYRKIFDYELTVGLELEFQLGASMDRVGKWNFMADALFSKIETEMKWQKEELGYKPDFKHIDIARDNWKIIADVRKRELKEAVKSKKPSEIMLITPENARKLGFKIGLPA